QERDTGERFEFLLTDLPGEWTRNLINNADNEKQFGFLRRADGIILVIDGPSIMAHTSRHAEVLRAKVLLSRLVNDVKVDLRTPLVLLVSKADKIEGAVPVDIETIKGLAQQLGFSPVVILASAFSEIPDRIPNGSGIM